jgi:hypothetical protein
MHECPKNEEAASYTRGEMTAADAAAFDEHLNTCASCRELVSDFRRIVEELKRRPAATVSHDLAEDILRRIPESAWREEDDARSGMRLWLSPVALRAAAGFLVILGGGLLAWHFLRSGAEPKAIPPAARTLPPQAQPAAARAEAIHGALGWLASAQDPSGAWDPARWGGKKDYEISLTGMALLAFMGDKDGLRIAEHEQAVERGLEYLMQQQGTNGALGAEHAGRMYNQGIGTVALLEAYRLKDGPRVKAAVGLAIRHICEQQHENGGWGYEKGPTQQPNTSITAWQMKALFLAWQSGWKETDTNLKKGLAWLRSVVDEQGLFGYQRPRDVTESNETLTAMGALCFFLAESQGREGGRKDAADARIRMALKSAAANPGKQQDYYRWYFVASALSAGKEAGYDQLLADIQNQLLQERSRDAAQTGSWDPVGRWSSVGGRLYTTTMATLSLQERAPDGHAM